MKKNIFLLSSAIIALFVVTITGCSKDDTVAPEITLSGSDNIVMGKGETYSEPGASATDDEDGSVTVTNDASTALDTDEPGVYTITYTASDKAGNAATAIRTVTVNWKGSQLAPFPYINIESDSAFGTVLPDSIGATVTASSVSSYHFSFTPIFQHSITAPIIGRVHDGTKITFEAQKPNGTGSTVTVESIGTGTVTHSGSQILLNFKVLVTDSTNTPPDKAYCTISARSN